MARRARGFRAKVALAALAYLLVVALVPALHHDFQCHVQHPGHCDACRALVAAPDATGLAPELLPSPEQSGQVASEAESPRADSGPRANAGRAPPASA